jgi:hypothetical protein
VGEIKMTKKIVIFFDERLGTVHRVIKIYGLDVKKKMRENQSHIKIKNQNNYNIKKGEKVCLL